MLNCCSIIYPAGCSFAAGGADGCGRKLRIGCVQLRTRLPAGISRLTLVVTILLAAETYAQSPDGPEADKSTTATTVDLRGELERMKLPPRAQGDRNTCSVFAIVGAMEYALAVSDGHGGRLSIEYLNWASNRVVGKAEDGSFFSDLWKGFTRYGACPESDMPYDPTGFDASRRPSRTVRLAARKTLQCELELHWIKPWDPHKGLSDEQFAAVKQVLRDKWPVCGGFLWPKQATWTNGVLDMPPREDVRDGHSVLLVGYHDDPNQPGGGYFIVRDSGKRRLGNKMSYEYVRAYMNDAVWIEPSHTADRQSR